MEYYRRYLQQLNKRLLTISIVLLFFWFEHNFYPLFPETKSLLQYVVARITAFLAFAAWPFLLISIGQILLNRFVYYSYDGEVRPQTFSFEISSFLKHSYLYTVAVLLLIYFGQFFSSLVDLGYQGYAEQLRYSPISHAVVLLVRGFTLNLGINTFTFFESLVLGLTIVLLYVGQSIIAFEPMGVRDKRALPGNQRSSFKETHNVLINRLHKGHLGTYTYWLVVVGVLLGYIVGVVFSYRAGASAPAISMFILPLLGYLLHLALRYIHYGWDKVFNLKDTAPCRRYAYEDREEWLDSSDFRQLWRNYQPSSLFRFQFKKEHLWPMPLRLAYVGVIELVFAFLLLAFIGLWQQGMDSEFYDMAASLQLFNMFTAVWAESGIFVRLGLGLYALWRLFARLRQFAFQLRYSGLDMDKFGTLPKFIYAVVLESVFFIVVLSIAGLIMFSFHEAFVRLVLSFDILTMIQVIYANSSWTWKAILGGYLGWRALVRIGRFRIGLFDLLGNWLPDDD